MPAVLCRRAAVGVPNVPEDAPVTIATFAVLILCGRSTRVVRKRPGYSGGDGVQLTRVRKSNGNREGGCARVICELVAAPAPFASRRAAIRLLAGLPPASRAYSQAPMASLPSRLALAHSLDAAAIPSIPCCPLWCCLPRCPPSPRLLCAQGLRCYVRPVAVFIQVRPRPRPRRCALTLSHAQLFRPTALASSRDMG